MSRNEMEWGAEFLEETAICFYGGAAGRMQEEAGWIYASGECPYVETTLVEATAHG